jgi:hypothetical protein
MHWLQATVGQIEDGEASMSQANPSRRVTERLIGSPAE